MNGSPFSAEEQEAIRKWFGKVLEELDEPSFRETLRDLRAKYHPDKFEKFEDDTIREMALDRFQQIEQLARKIDAYFQGEIARKTPAADPFSPGSRFAFDDLKIEILTNEKDLKYHLFGVRYRWLRFGDRFTIPGTKASIIIDEDHQGRSIGYQESIRMYLTFSASEKVDLIAAWLFDKIKGRAQALLIKGEKTPFDQNAITNAIKRVSLLPPG
jgi:hypothetical protein